MAFFDVFAMPADAKNKDEAYQFLNYLLRPDAWRISRPCVLYQLQIKQPRRW